MTPSPDTGDGLVEDLRVHAELIRQNDGALSGKDIACIRNGDGDLDLAKRVVNLKGAAQWGAAKLDEAASRISALEGEVEGLKEQISSVAGLPAHVAEATATDTHNNSGRGE